MYRYINRSKYKTPSDPFQVLFLKDIECDRGYSYVGKQVRDNYIDGMKQICPNCKSSMLIRDIRKWRATGAVLICHVCAGVKPGNIVANDNYEILKVGPGHNVLIPDRLKKAKCDYEKKIIEERDAGIQWINGELKSEPNNIWLYVHRAGLLAKKNFGQKNYEQIWREDIEKALRIEPNNPMVYAWRAYLTTSKSECIESLKLVLELDPSYELAYLYLATAYLPNDKSKFKTILEKALSKFPNSTRARELYNKYLKVKINE